MHAALALCSDLVAPISQRFNVDFELPKGGRVS
jgi:hypothetical protein